MYDHLLLVLFLKKPIACNCTGAARAGDLKNTGDSGWKSKCISELMGQKHKWED